MFTVKLAASDREALIRHFLELPDDDRRMRFGATLGDTATRAYVQRIDFTRDTLFGVWSDDLALVGCAHLALDDAVAELGISVLPPHRRRGIGSALVSRAAVHARNCGIPVLFMHCLTENRSMVRIAQALGMRVVSQGGETDAHLALPPPTAATFACELMQDGIALCDHSLRSHFLAARRLLDAATSSGSGRKSRERAA